MPATGAIHEFLRVAHVTYTVVPHRPRLPRKKKRRRRTSPVATGRRWLSASLTANQSRPSCRHRHRESRSPAGARRGQRDPPRDEDELRQLFPDCELGAMPPFGPLYGQTVFVDASLASEPEIVFNAGTHRDAIAMRWNDFVKMVNPIVGRSPSGAFRAVDGVIAEPSPPTVGTDERPPCASSDRRDAGQQLASSLTAYADGRMSSCSGCREAAFPWRTKWPRD